MSMVNDKRANLFIILSGIFLTNAVIAEIIGVKIFSAESTLGIAAGQISILGFQPEFNLTAGVVIWPVVFITTDIINEYFGKEGVRKISYLTTFLILFVFIAIYMVTLLPPADFWIDVNRTDSEGNTFDIDFAFKTIFRQGLGIIIGSLVAFLIGQLLDVYIFQKLRRFTGSKMIWLRATGSTLISQFIDSFVVLVIAFYIWGNWSLSMVMAVGMTNYIYKFLVAILLTPLIYAGHYFIDLYLGEELSKQMTDDAAAGSEGFL